MPLFDLGLERELARETPPRNFGLLHPREFYEELFWYARLALQEGYKIPREFGDLRQHGFFKSWWSANAAWKLFAVEANDLTVEVVKSLSLGTLRDYVISTLTSADPYEAINELKILLEDRAPADIKLKNHAPFKLAVSHSMSIEAVKYFRHFRNKTAGSVRNEQINNKELSEVAGFMESWNQQSLYRAAYSKLLELNENDTNKMTKVALSFGAFKNNKLFTESDILTYLDLKKKRTRALNHKNPTASSRKQSDHASEQRSKGIAENMVAFDNWCADLSNKHHGFDVCDYMGKKIDLESRKIRDWKNRCIETFIGIGAKPFTFPRAPIKMHDDERKKYEQEAAERKACGEIAFS